MEKYLVSEEDKKAVRAFLNISDETVKSKVKALTVWIEECPHLPLESKNEDFLNMMLLRGKFKEDLVRVKIDNYFNYIRRHPKMFMGYNNLKPSQEVGVAVLLPKPTSSWERIAILKLRPEKLDKDLDLQRCFMNGLATAMIIFHFDYVPSSRMILDFEGFKLNHILQANINDLVGLVGIHENVLKMRITGIEILNASQLLSAVLRLAKLVLKPKLFSRISVHEDLESLYKNVSKQYLPSDYGGEQESIENLLPLLDKTLWEKRHFFQKIEDLIDTSQVNQDVFGVTGSFKTLDID